MSTPLFFLYNIISLILFSMASVRLKNVTGVDAVKYINNVAIIVTSVLVTAAVTTFATLKLGCSSPREGINFNAISSVILVAMGIFVEGISIAVVSNQQFAACPADVRNIFIIALVFNSLGILAALGYTFYKRS